MKLEQKVLRFIFTGNSNKKLDNLCKEVTNLVDKYNGIYSGPVRFKGRRLVDIKQYNTSIISKLFKVHVKKGIKVEIFELDDKYYISKKRNKNLKKLII